MARRSGHLVDRFEFLTVEKLRFQLTDAQLRRNAREEFLDVIRLTDEIVNAGGKSGQFAVDLIMNRDKNDRNALLSLAVLS